MHDLFANYTISTRRFARPVNDSLKPIEVYFGLRLMKVELDEKYQRMKTSVWLRVVSIQKFRSSFHFITLEIDLFKKWYDETLKWNPDDYDNTTAVTVPHGHVWLPDIALVNT